MSRPLLCLKFWLKFCFNFFASNFASSFLLQVLLQVNALQSYWWSRTYRRSEPGWLSQVPQPTCFWTSQSQAGTLPGWLEKEDKADLEVDCVIYCVVFVLYIKTLNRIDCILNEIIIYRPFCNWSIFWSRECDPDWQEGRQSWFKNWLCFTCVIETCYR